MTDTRKLNDWKPQPGDAFLANGSRIYIQEGPDSDGGFCIETRVVSADYLPGDVPVTLVSRASLGVETIHENDGMAKYRKKPVVIEAVEWTGGNAVSLIEWIGRGAEQDGPELIIKTLEGNMTASLGDYIIRGVSGEHYPCKPDIFHKTYDAVEDET